MNKLINKYLTSMEFYVNFTLDENFEETIKSRYRDEFTYASFSEGEKMRIDLALLFTWRAVAKMKNSTNTNLLILDEIFDSSLDGTGTDEFLKILNTLSGENVFVISHKQDVLVDKFRSTIKFEKIRNFSHVNRWLKDFTNYDECYTPCDQVLPLLDYLDKDKTYYEATSGISSQIVDGFKKYKYNIMPSGEKDFFTCKLRMYMMVS